MSNNATPLPLQVQEQIIRTPSPPLRVESPKPLSLQNSPEKSLQVEAAKPAEESEAEDEVGKF